MFFNWTNNDFFINSIIKYIISIAIFALLSLSIDLLECNFDKQFYVFIFSFIFVTVESFVYTYYKYLIEIKYYSFTTIIFHIGIMNIVTIFLLLIIIIFAQRIENNNILIYQFYENYNEYGATESLIIIILISIVRGFLENFLNF